MKKFIASSAPGKTWSLFVGKTRAGFVYGAAVEGDLVLGKDTGSQFDSFSHEMFSARRVEAVTAAKRMTDRASAAAMVAIEASLRDGGMLAKVEEN